MADDVLDPPPPLAPGLVAGSFAEPAWQRAIVDRVSGDPTFLGELHAAVAELARGEPQVALATESVLIGAPSLAAASTPAATLGLLRDERERRAARAPLEQPGVTAVVFGHTHVVVDGDLDGRLCNPGTWMPHLDLRSPAVRERIQREGITLEFLKDRSLFTSDRLAVLIEPQAVSARVQLISCDDA